MKSNPKPSKEYTAFESLLKRVVQVPHSEIKARLDAEEQVKKKSVLGLLNRLKTPAPQFVEMVEKGEAYTLRPASTHD